MKVISIKQPWASLIVQGVKDIENRTWKCPEKYIGQIILIHASSKTAGYPNELLNYEQFQSINSNDINKSFDSLLHVSEIIGSVEIVDCVINHESIWAEKTEINRITNEKGRSIGVRKNPTYNWVLANPILFDEPITDVKGKLRFWNYELPKGYFEKKIERKLKA